MDKARELYSKNLNSNLCIFSIGEVLLICLSILFRVCLSVRKLYEISWWASSYVCVYSCVLRSRLTDDFKSVDKIELMKKHCFESDLCIESLMNRKQGFQYLFPKLSFSGTRVCFFLWNIKWPSEKEEEPTKELYMANWNLPQDYRVLSLPTKKHPGALHT